MVDLTKTSIDFQDLVAELEADLKTRDSFQALFPGETGKIFTEHGAGITALMLYHIHSAAQNAFFPTAFSKQAVYALAASLGRPPRRKLGAQVNLQLTVNTPLAASVTLPKYSRFSARGLEWYTTEDYVIPAGAADQVIDINNPLVLRQGERIIDTFSATGNANQRIELGDEFNVDEFYLDVTVDGTPYIKNGSSLLNAEAGDLVYAEQTASNGRVLVLFGNNVIGNIPTLGNTIEISYSNTVGINSNSSVVNDPFQYLEVFDIGGGTLLELTATSTSSSSDGSDEETIEQVRNVAPKIYAANSRAVRRDDYLGFLLTYTAANAGSVWGEYEEATQKGFANLTMMNKVYVSHVPNDIVTQSEVLLTSNNSLTYTGSFANTNIVPGSIILESTLTSASRPATWRDYDGKGLLVTDEILLDIIDGTGVSSSNDGGSPGLAFDRGITYELSDFESTTQPTPFNPVRIGYDFGAGNEEFIKSVRLRAGPVVDAVDRGFPKKIVILASNLTSPDINDRNDWEVIRGAVELDDPGYLGIARWIPVDDINNTTAYRHLAIEVLEVHNNAPITKIAVVEAQNEANVCTVDYEAGTYSFNFGGIAGDAFLNGSDVDAGYLSGAYSTTQKTQLLDYLDDFNHFTTLIEYRDPVSVPLNIVATVYFLEGFDSGTILSNVQTAIDNLFLINSDTIGNPLYLSDIYQSIQDVEGVDYTILENPTTDTPIEIDQFVTLNSKTLNILPTDR